MCNPVQHPPVKRQHQPRTNSVHTQLRLNRQLWLRQAISAVNARNSESDKQKTRTSATHNLQFLPKAQYDHKRNPYRCTRARFSFAFSRSALNSLRSTAGASRNTRDIDGRRVTEHARHRFPHVFRLLQSFPGQLDNELVAACSPLDSRDAPDVVLALVLQLLENLELADDLELVIGVNPHPRHVDVA